MALSTKIFKPETYTYKDYKLWEGNWELVNGYPHAMSPSPNRKHQGFASKFSRVLGNILENEKVNCDCEVYCELDWIVNENTVVRPDCMVVCGEFSTDFLTVPPHLILEISSPSTNMRDRNTKFKLYEMCGVKYYIIADVDKKNIEVFELFDNEYKSKTSTEFMLTPTCIINFDVFKLMEGE